MKYLKIILCFFALAAIITACDKADTLSTIPGGNTPVLSSNTPTVAAAASDSDNTVLTFSWTNPQYATDSTTVKYILQVDSANGDFSHATNLIVNGKLDTALTGRQINSLLLDTYGLKIGVPYSFKARLISSYANNNNQKTSNTINLNLTAYHIPPKVAPPASGHLYLVGDATDGGWNNPVPTPTQEFSQIDSVTYAGVFHITGGNQFLMLPVNGDWGHKYAANANNVNGQTAGGDVFGYDSPDNFSAPATSGWYVIWVDFQAGKFTVTPFNGPANGPTSLFMVGDATQGGWNNPVPVPDQQFTQDNSAQFHLTTTLNGGKQYLFLPVNGDWSNKYAVNDNSIPGLSNGGSFGYNLGQNFPGPATDGTYTITVNFANYTFSVK